MCDDTDKALKEQGQGAQKRTSSGTVSWTGAGRVRRGRPG